MQDFADALFRQFLIRNSYGEKVSFLHFFGRQLSNQGYPISLQKKKVLGILNQNLIAGDIARADVIVFAHYDTPRTRLFPFVKYIHSPLLSLLLTGFPLLLIGLLCYLLTRLFLWPPAASASLFAILAFASFFALRNKHNCNDSSSLLALYALAEKLKGTGRICLVLLDNHHFFGLGARAFKNQYSGRLEQKSAVVLEYVGTGSRFCLEYSQAAAGFAQKIEQQYQAALFPVKRKGFCARLYRADKTPLGYCICDLYTAQDVKLEFSYIQDAANALIDALS